jgi:hypothetical protein
MQEGRNSMGATAPCGRLGAAWVNPGDGPAQGLTDLADGEPAILDKPSQRFNPQDSPANSHNHLSLKDLSL